MKYRSEIDGLRAFAVLPVLLFHAGVDFVSGGYLGVDIFFVISGYLITYILVTDLSNGTFSLVNFYERRARRILPALFFVLFISTICSYLLLSPLQLRDYSQSLVAVVSFLSNVYFYLTSGYFSNAAEELPLLHTWSLAVEEQYYVLFPLLLAALWRSKTVLLFAISAIAIGSFLLALHLAESDSSANFYLLPSRGWELLVGAGAALWAKKSSEIGVIKKEVLTSIGAIVVLASLLFLDTSYSHPGWATIFPVLGTAIVILFSNGTFIGKALSIKPVVTVGMISYSLYLWHQPIFALIRVKSIVEPTITTMLSAMFLSLILAYFSYHFVEQPFRGRKVSRGNIFKFSAIGLSVFFAIGIIGHTQSGFSNRYENQEIFETVTFSPYRFKCHSVDKNIRSFQSDCVLSGKNNPDWAVLGDSHGVELSFALAQKLGEEDRVQQLTYSGCPPAITFDTLSTGCKKWLKKSIDIIVSSKSLHNIIVVFRHIGYTSNVKTKYEKVSGEAKQFNFPKIVLSSDSQSMVENAHLNAYWESFEQIISTIKGGGKQVYIVYPVPEPETHIAKLITPFSIFHTSGRNLIIDKQDILQYTRSIRGQLDRIQAKYKTGKIEPMDALCDMQYCYSVKDNRAMFFDDDHLSLHGASTVIEVSGITDE